PFLDACKTVHSVNSCKGGTIYCETFLPEADFSAVIVIFHGFCEYCAKYDELTYYMLRQGFAVCRFDHRGHGFSARDVSNPYKVHIEDYQIYADDAFSVVMNIAKPLAGNAPLFLFAHSMGGAIASLFLQQYPDVFKTSVLSSPMFMLNILGLPFGLARIITKILCFFRGSKSYIPGKGDFPPHLTFNKSSKPSISERRFMYHYRNRLGNTRLQTWSGTLAWLDASLDAIAQLRKKQCLRQICTPIMLFQAEKDETVLPGGQNAFVKKVTSAQLVVVPNANHEIYNMKNELLISWYSQLFAFYREYC
ncbi:MAG: alpha/beta fold hydrolase, partial [Spirochaetales bacterium]